MTEFEEKYLEELKKQHEESIKHLKQCDMERRIKEEEFNEGCHKLGLVMLAITVICFIIETLWISC